MPEPVHCRCDIPITDGAKIYYQCVYSASKPERDRRIAAQDYQPPKETRR